MNRRKLQIFLSSTYEDLIDERLAAMEAILAAGHIPAAMEQFSPGDDTAWERICRWIEGSDAFILILGGRYGSIEPTSGKSYVQLEYEYAVDKKKPFFSLVVSEKHHDERVREFGLKVDERTKQAEYAAFKVKVTGRLCGFWNDTKDIERAIFHKLPEWAEREDLVGWIRADETPSAATANELARLSEENRELRERVSARAEDFHGLTFEEMVRLLRKRRRPMIDENEKLKIEWDDGPASSERVRNAGEFFEAVYDILGKKAARLRVGEDPIITHYLDELVSIGLVQRSPAGLCSLSQSGRHFKNRLLLQGDAIYRHDHFWSPAIDRGDSNSGG